MDVPDPRNEAELRRGVLQLVALALLEEPRYGYELVRLLGEAGFQTEEGTLYPILRRFEEQGALEATWDTSRARPRKYYRLSEDGRRVERPLAAWRKVAPRPRPPWRVSQAPFPVPPPSTGTSTACGTCCPPPRGRGLIEDHIEQDPDGAAYACAADRALAALGPPETLASALSGETVVIDLATRRAYTRMLTVVFAAHLLLCIILTVIAPGSDLIPGLVGALPRTPWGATLTSVLALFFVDAGALLVFFRLLGTRRAPGLLRGLPLQVPVRRRDAALSLVLLGLLAVILNVPSLRDQILAVGVGEDRSPVLAPAVTALTLAADAVLILFAVRHLLLLLTGVERVQGVVLDALASLAGAILAVLLMTRVTAGADPGLRLHGGPGGGADLLFRVVFVVWWSRRSSS
jgi:hypothetical protein